MRDPVKKAALLLLALALAGALTACGDNASPVQEDPPWYEMDDSQGDAASGEGLTSFALAYHRGQTLDPLLCDEGAQAQLASLLYEPLFLLDESFTPQPWLCESYTVSEDGLTYTLTIRQNVSFSDGSSLSAADAAASLRRAMDAPRYAARLSDIQSVSATGAGQVRITLRAANSGLRQYAGKMCEKHGYRLFLPPVSLCGDNGAMVASQGFYEFEAGVRAGLDLNARATMEISDAF